MCVCVCRCEWVCAVSRCVFGGRVCEHHGKLQVCVSAWIQEQQPADQLSRWRWLPVYVLRLFVTETVTAAARSVSSSDIDECQLNPCRNGRCDNTPGSYRCVCRLGYRLVGNTCTGKDAQQQWSLVQSAGLDHLTRRVNTFVFQMWTSVRTLCCVQVRSVSTLRARTAVRPVSLDMDSSTGSVQVTHTCVRCSSAEVRGHTALNRINWKIPKNI